MSPVYPAADSREGKRGCWRFPPVRVTGAVGRRQEDFNREAIMPGEQDRPSTLRRSPRKAQETYIKAHDAAVDQYGEGERAHRVAFAAVKHSFEKVGDRWQAKPEMGPSDA